MIKTLVNLSEYQIRKIKDAYENKASVRIYLSYKKIEWSGEYTILSTEAQKKRLDKNKQLKKGVILELKYEQLKANHSGGFLPILFAALSAIRALAGGGAAIANSVISSKHQAAEEEEMKRQNSAMEKIAQRKEPLRLGSGVVRGEKKKTQNR